MAASQDWRIQIKWGICPPLRLSLLSLCSRRFLFFSKKACGGNEIEATPFPLPLIFLLTPGTTPGAFLHSPGCSLACSMLSTPGTGEETAATRATSLKPWHSVAVGWCFSTLMFSKAAHHEKGLSLLTQVNFQELFKKWHPQCLLELLIFALCYSLGWWQLQSVCTLVLSHDQAHLQTNSSTQCHLIRQ